MRRRGGGVERSVSPYQCMRIVMMFIEDIVPSNHQCKVRPTIFIPTHPALSNEGGTKESRGYQGVNSPFPGLMSFDVVIEYIKFFDVDICLALPCPSFHHPCYTHIHHTVFREFSRQQLCHSTHHPGRHPTQAFPGVVRPRSFSFIHI